MDFELFLVYFLTTVLLATPVLLLGLSRRHPWTRRLFAGVWLSACSYPIVFFVLPELIDRERYWKLYLLVAEVFAPVSECALFYAAFLAPKAAPPGAAPAPADGGKAAAPTGSRAATWQDFA